MSINESNLVKKLTTVTNTQDSVQTLSLWIIHHRAHHRKIVDIWSKVLRKSKPVHRLTMLYLANDVLQNGKRKGVQQFIESFADILPEQTPLFRDERITKQVDRVFSIWAERSVFSSDFTSGLKDILHNRSSSKHHHISSEDGTKPTKDTSKKEAPGKAKNPETERIILEFKPETTIEKIKKLKKIELETSTKLANLTSRNMDVSSSEVLRKFKDRSHGQQFQKDFDEATRCLEEYIKALEKEVAERAELVGLLEDAKVFYDSQNGEARIVATAYKNFGNRVKGLKKKLEAKVKTLPSPVPSPTPDAPSPTNSDDGLQLPAMQETAPAASDDAAPTGNGDSPGSAPSPEGSPDGLSPVAPETGDSATTSNATGNAAALSSFMSQSPTVLSSWLDAFNQEFQESKAVSATVNPSLLAAAVPEPSTLESRLSNLMQTMGHIPGGLFSSAASSASNTPKRADSPPYASATPRPAAAVLSEVHSGNTPLKDENSGQGTPVLDENSARKAASLLDSDMRVHPAAKPNSALHDSPEPRMNAAAFGSKIPSLASPSTWAQASPTAAVSAPPAAAAAVGQAMGAPALAPPPLPPALQAYLEPIQTVTGAAHRGGSTVAPKGRSETPPSPSADYLIPVAENFDVTDMDLDDESGDDEHAEAALHRNKKLSNLITLVQPQVSPAANTTAASAAAATTTSGGEGSEESQPAMEQQPILPPAAVASVLDIASSLANQANLRSLLESIELAKQEPSSDFLARNSPLEPRSREADFLARNSPLGPRSRESDFLARNSPLEPRSRDPTSDFLARNSPLEPRSRDPTSDFLARNSPLEPRSRELTADFLTRDSPLEPRLRDTTADFLTRESSLEPRLREPASDFLTRDPPLETRSRDPTADFLTHESPSEPRLREPSSDFLARDSALEPRLREPSSDFRARESSSELHSREAADFRSRESSSELRLRESSDFTTRESSEFRLRESADFATRESSEFRLNESSDYMARERSEFQVRESPSSDFRMRDSSSSEFHIRDSSSEFRVHDSPSSSEFHVHDSFASDFHAAPAKIETVQMRSSLDRSPPLAPLEDRGGVWERGDYYTPRTSHHQLQQQQQQHHQPMSNGGNRSRGRGSGYYGYEMRGRPMDRFREGYGSYDPEWHTGRPPSPRYRPYGGQPQQQQQQQQQRGGPYFQPRY